jgi:hypothetical protein
MEMYAKVRRAGCIAFHAAAIHIESTASASESHPHLDRARRPTRYTALIIPTGVLLVAVLGETLTLNHCGKIMAISGCISGTELDME